jgi:hypothetical protein
MNDEVTSQSQVPAETPTETPAPSLDDIASEFSVEKEVNQFQAQPTPPCACRTRGSEHRSRPYL